MTRSSLTINHLPNLAPIKLLQGQCEKERHSIDSSNVSSLTDAMVTRATRPLKVRVRVRVAQWVRVRVRLELELILGLGLRLGLVLRLGLPPL